MKDHKNKRIDPLNEKKQPPKEALSHPKKNNKNEEPLSNEQYDDFNKQQRKLRSQKKID